MPEHRGILILRQWSHPMVLPKTHVITGRKDIPILKKCAPYQEQKDYETIEQDIASLEEQLEQLEQDIVGAATDFVRLNELTAQKSEIEAALEQKMDRWMYLEELAEELGLK